MKITLDGVLTFPATPMDEAGKSLNLSVYEKHIDWLADSGVHAIIPLGSTGEFAYLTPDERRQITDATVATVAGRTPSVIGVSALTTADAVSYAEHAHRAGADGILLSIPTYYALTADDVEKHVTAVAAAADLPMILYNNPFTSQVDLTIDLLDRLVRIETLVGVKEATKDVNRIPVLQRAFGDRLAVLGGGFDPYALAAFAVGARGWTTGMASLVPQRCVELHHAAVIEKDLSKAQEISAVLAPLANFLTSHNLSAAVKSGLHAIGYQAGSPRPPLQPLAADAAAELSAILADLGAVR